MLKLERQSASIQILGEPTQSFPESKNVKSPSQTAADPRHGLTESGDTDLRIISLRIDRPRQAAKQTISKTWLREQRRGVRTKGRNPLNPRLGSHPNIPTSKALIMVIAAKAEIQRIRRCRCCRASGLRPMKVSSESNIMLGRKINVVLLLAYTSSML